MFMYICESVSESVDVKSRFGIVRMELHRGYTSDIKLLESEEELIERRLGSDDSLRIAYHLKLGLVSIDNELIGGDDRDVILNLCTRMALVTGADWDGDILVIQKIKWGVDLSKS